MFLLFREERKYDTKKTHQYVATMSVCVGAIIAGTLLGWSAPVYKQLSSILTNTEKTLMSSMLAIGAALAAVPVGYVAQNIGRRLTVMFLTIPFAFSWSIIIFFNNEYLLIAARFIGGIGTGGVFVCVPMYIGEIAEPSIRGSLVAYFQTCITLGILFSYVLGGFMPWKKFSMACVVFVPIMLMVAWFLPETPQYLLYKKLDPRAEKSLKWLRGSKANLEAELKEMQKEIDDAAQDEANICTMLSRRGPRKGLICALGLMFFQQFSGVNAVIFYSTDILHSARSTIHSTVATILVGVVQTISTYLSSVMVDYTGRKVLLYQSCGLMGFSHVVLGAYFTFQANGYNVSDFGWAPVFCLMTFIISFSLGLGPVPWIMMSELYPVQYRGSATGVTVVSYWTMVFIVTLCFPIMRDIIGIHNCFWFFSAIMCLGICFVFLIIPETKGKTIAEIQEILNDEMIRTDINAKDVARKAWSSPF